MSDTKEFVDSRWLRPLHCWVALKDTHVAAFMAPENGERGPNRSGA
jgi:hypothetical protein